MSRAFSPAMAEWSTDKILDFLDVKAGGIVPPEVFREMFGTRMQTYAFTVSRLSGMEMIQDVYEALEAVEKAGGTFASFSEAVGDILDSTGWTKLDPWHIQNIYRTNMATVYNSARLEYQMQVMDDFPWWYLHVIVDTRTTRDICLPLANPPIILPANHAWFRTHWPPLHFQCRTENIALTNSMKQEFRYRQVNPDNIVKIDVDRKHGFGRQQKLGDTESIQAQIQKTLKEFGYAA